MKNKLYALFVILTLVLGLTSVNASAKTDNLVQDMVLLDRYYITVLAYTSQEKLEPSSQAMTRLLPVWKDFNKKHRDMAKQESFWKQDMSKIDKYIQAANKVVHSGKNLKDAHEELEHVRIVMMTLRERNKIEYFIDHLTHFHEPMEALVLTVKDKSVADINSETISKMKSEIKTAQALWQQVTQAKFDPALFGFNAEKTKTVNNLMVKETAALTKLEEALSGSDMNMVIQAGLAIKPPFAKMFMLFGALD